MAASCIATSCDFVTPVAVGTATGATQRIVKLAGNDKERQPVPPSAEEVVAQTKLRVGHQGRLTIFRAV